MVYKSTSESSRESSLSDDQAGKIYKGFNTLYIMAAFRSRTQTLEFLDMLRYFNVRAELVNTLKEAGVGCGLSVRFSEENLHTAKNALLQKSFSAFAGFFKVSNLYGKINVKAV